MGSLGSPFLFRGPHKDHLAVFDYPGFVVEFNTYKIMEMNSMSLTPLLKDGFHIEASVYIPEWFHTRYIIQVIMCDSFPRWC